MADQKRWFKLWCSAPADDDVQRLAASLRWAWAALGCYTKLHGTRGRVAVSPTNTVLAAEMGVPVEALISTIKALPHLDVEEGISVNGQATVTWHNWQKYQEDSTVAERVARLRSKRRGEENKKKIETLPPLPPTNFVIADSILGALGRCRKLGVVAKLRDPAYWQAVVRAYPGVDLPAVILDAESFLATPRGAHYADLATFLRNSIKRQYVRNGAGA